MILNLFRGKKKRTADYIPNMDEYAELEQSPEELRVFRVLYAYTKIIFFLLFSAGFAFSFIPFYFYFFAAWLSLIISFCFKKRFLRLLNTRLKLFVFFASPPVCVSTGFFFGRSLFYGIAKITQG